MKNKFLSLLFISVNMTALSQVGIGTNTPSKPLEIVSNTNAQLKVAALSGNNNADIDLSPTGTGLGVIGPIGNSPLTLRTNNTERIRITEAGKIGVGITSPTTTLHIENGNILSGDPSNNTVPSIYLFNSNNSSTSAHSTFSIRTKPNGGNPYISFDVQGIKGHSIGIDNADEEKLKFFSNWDFTTSAYPTLTMTTGNFVGIGTTSPGSKLEVSSGDPTTIKITSTTSDNNGMLILNANTPDNWSSSWHEFIYFQKQGNSIGAITNNSNGGINYNTTSDYRLKTDFRNFDGLEIVNKMKVYDYAWKSNNERMYGFKAHEIQDVIPYSVIGKKDEVDTNGNPKYQMVDYSKITPVLAKAIQEQQEIIGTLQQRIEQLEKTLQQILNLKK